MPSNGHPAGALVAQQYGKKISRFQPGDLQWPAAKKAL